MQFPTGCWGFVGSLPRALGDVVPASTADVMGGRAWREDGGRIVTMKFPTFPTEDGAREHATARGVETRGAP